MNATEKLRELLTSNSNLSKIVNEYINKFFESLDKYSNGIKNVRDLTEELNAIDVDLTTYEGYSKYMKELGDLREKISEYNDFIKMLTGKTGTEILDGIAAEATSYYLENKNDNKDVKENKEKTEQTKEENKNPGIFRKEKDNSIDKDPKIDLTEEHKKDNCSCANKDICAPSENMSRKALKSLDVLIEKYFDESLIPWSKENEVEITDEELDYLHDEFVEFACWIRQQEI
jgi:hypothetical protein